MQGFLKRTLALSSLLVLPLISLDATARRLSRYRRDYQSLEFRQCAADLIRVGLAVEQTKAACAMALEPTDLSNCVVGIALTPVSPQNALYSCFRVRRPVELAQCVVDIHRDVLAPKFAEGAMLNDVALSTLDHCRRSLLPLRYSACVVGLSGELTTLDPQNAIATCITAEDFPREIYTPAPNNTLGTDS